MDVSFQDRVDAGRQLASVLVSDYAGRDDTLVLGLPRGGVPVAFEVAAALDAPLDVLIVRKLGVPMNKEYAMGAIATGGVTVLSHDVVDALGVSKEAIATVRHAEGEELMRREALYRGNRPPPTVGGRTVIVVDDGLATGSTMHAAILALRQQEPAAIVAAVPVASSQACALIGHEADRVVCLATPLMFRAVGVWYDSFPQTSDAEVRELLGRGYGHV